MSALNEYPFLIEFVNNLIEKEKFQKNCEIFIKNGTQKGEGFLGEIYFLTLKDSDKTLSLVAKSALRNEHIRKKIGISDIYFNEIYFYNKIYPSFKQFEKEVGSSNCFNSIPKFYGYSLSNCAETLGLENLQTSGFEVFNKKLCFDQNHLNLVFKNYAHLHAISFAIKDQHPELLEKLVSKLKNILKDMTQGNNFTKGLSDSAHEIYYYLKENGNYKLLAPLEKYKENCISIFQNCFEYEGNYSAILHGDCWSNNMMIKYADVNNERAPVELKFLDFQLSLYSTPVLDLSYLFYSSASKEEVHNLDRYLKLYYEYFSIYVKDLGSDPTTVYPFQVLKEEWKKYAKFGFIMSLMLIKIKLTEKEDAQDLNEVFSENQGFVKKYDKSEYLNRIENIVVHLNAIDAL